MNDKSLPWIERYRPATRDELVGNAEAIGNLFKWIRSWKNGLPDRRAALLIGPPGTGKTSTVGAIANDLLCELVEFNASDKRNKDVIETQVFHAATQGTIDGRCRIILLDEVDGLSGTGDRGGVSAILRVIEKTIHPIIMTANDPNSPRLKDLLKRCIVLQFMPLNRDAISQILHRVLEDSSESVPNEIMNLITEGSKGDLRAAIADLESVAGRQLEDVDLGERDLRTSIEQGLKKLFMTRDPSVARIVINQTDVSHDELLLWLEENIHLHLGTNAELEQGLDSLSIADLCLGRIMRQQNWKLLSYAYDFLSTFIATSRSVTPYRKVSYSRPKWPLLIWKAQRKRGKYDFAIGRVSKTANVSRSKAFEYVKLIERIIEVNPKQKHKMAEWLGVKASQFR